MQSDMDDMRAKVLTWLPLILGALVVVFAWPFAFPSETAPIPAWLPWILLTLWLASAALAKRLGKFPNLLHAGYLAIVVGFLLFVVTILQIGREDLTDAKPHLLGTSIALLLTTIALAESVRRMATNDSVADGSLVLKLIERLPLNRRPVFSPIPTQRFS